MWHRTIVASSIEPEGPRRILAIVLPDAKDWKAELHAAITRVYELIFGGGDYQEACNRDWRGEYVPGRVQRDVTISRGDEILAVIKISDQGVYLIELPLAWGAQSCARLEHPILEEDGEPIITFEDGFLF
jgi:hypothetical protein